MQNGQQPTELSGENAEPVEFSLSLWRKQGAEALEALRRRKDGLEAELQILVRDLDDLERVLGESIEGPNGEQTRPESKVMIRKTIKAILMAGDIGDEGIPDEALIDRVLEHKPGSTAASVRISVQKLCKENPQFVSHEGRYYFISNVSSETSVDTTVCVPDS